MNKARLTYRLDRQPDPRKGTQPPGAEKKVIPLSEEEFRVVGDPQPLNEYTNDYGAWSSPFDAETRRIEQLIRQSQEKHPEVVRPSREASSTDLEEWEPPHHPETGYVEDDRYEPYQEETPRTVRERGYIPSTVRTVRYSKTPWIKVAASVTGAVATGALLGFFVLSLFSDDSGSKELPSVTGGGGSKSAVSAGKSGTADSQKAGGAKPDAASVPASAQAAAGTAASIPARTYTFLQTGGFGTAQAAEAQAAEIRKKGVAAVTEPGDTVFVYSGIAASKEDAKAVTASLIDKKIEVYAKTVSVAGASQIRWNGKAEALQTYLSQSDQLLRMISGLTLVHLEEAKPTPLDEATMTAVKKAHDQWTAGQAEVASGATAEAKTALQKMNNAMNTAKLSLDKYKEAPATATLWNAQTNLMQFVLAEKELLRIIGAS